MAKIAHQRQFSGENNAEKESEKSFHLRNP